MKIRDVTNKMKKCVYNESTSDTMAVILDTKTFIFPIPISTHVVVVHVVVVHVSLSVLLTFSIVV